MTIDISNIDAGDTVTAKFSTEPYGEFTVTGTAYVPNDNGSALDLCGWVLRHNEGALGSALVEVLEHVVAEPPLGFVGRDDDGDYWIHLPEGWILLPESVVKVRLPKPWANFIGSDLSNVSMFEVKP